MGAPQSSPPSNPPSQETTTSTLHSGRGVDGREWEWIQGVIIGHQGKVVQSAYFLGQGYYVLYTIFSNGVGRTGTFTSIYSQVERIKAEQMADIFQYVKGIRLQRADMVLEEVIMWGLGSVKVHVIFVLQSHFQFCHRVLADYLDSVDNYANFKDL